MAVAESPHWFAWPNGPTTKMSTAAQQQECKFLEASLKKGGEAFFCKEGCLFDMDGGFLPRQGTFLATRAKNCSKMALICTCVRTLKGVQIKTHNYFWEAGKYRTKTANWVTNSSFRIPFFI